MHLIVCFADGRARERLPALNRKWRKVALGTGLQYKRAIYRVLVDGEAIYTVEGARVGLFQGIQYNDYPWPGENDKGGRIER